MINYEEVINLSELDQPTHAILFGLYSQLTIGDCQLDTAQNQIQQAKLQAWMSLRGIPKQEALSQYINLLQGLKMSNGWAMKVSKMGTLEITQEFEEKIMRPQHSTDISELVEAIKTGNIPRVVEVLQSVDLLAFDSQGMTGLHHAVDQQNIEIVEILLEAGANPNAQDSWGMTSLHCAKELENQEIANLLIARGADPSIEDNTGNNNL